MFKVLLICALSVVTYQLTRAELSDENIQKDYTDSIFDEDFLDMPDGNYINGHQEELQNDLEHLFGFPESSSDVDDSLDEGDVIDMGVFLKRDSKGWKDGSSKQKEEEKNIMAKRGDKPSYRPKPFIRPSKVIYHHHRPGRESEDFEGSPRKGKKVPPVSRLPATTPRPTIRDSVKVSPP